MFECIDFNSPARNFTAQLQHKKNLFDAFHVKQHKEAE